MELKGRTVVVVGLGRSGIAAARLCRDRGARVVGTDRAPREKLPALEAERGLELRLGGHEEVPFETADLIVVSPGVPSLPELGRAEAAGVEVIGELELASRFARAPIVAVGGTNGKSTTTSLTFEMLKAAGRHAFIGGNFGTPACEAAEGDFDVLVLEVSSFQLERAPSFCPKVSVLLNVTEDHLDRYPSFLAYAEAKGNAFVNQGPDDVAVIPFGDRVCEEQAKRGRAARVSFGRGDYAVEAASVVEAASGERFELSGTALHGRHNHQNAAAAIAAVRALGAGSDAVRTALARFVALPHRMALCGELGGVRFYDDSKGTNVGAAVTALSGLTERLGVLIAGGRDKHGSYEPLAEALAERGRALVVLGEAAERMRVAVAGAVPTETADGMADAVRRAFRLAKPGDAVLLSPACSSFDMFKSYAERGDRFREAVEALAREVSS